MLASADVLLLPQRQEVVDTVVPSKLLTYLSCRRPVIAAVSDKSEAAQLLQKHEAGIVVPAQNSAALVAAIEHLQAHPEQAARLAAQGLEVVYSEFEKQVVMKLYQELFPAEEIQPSTPPEHPSALPF